MTCFECTYSVFNITNGNNSFSISIPCRWSTPNHLPEGIIDKLRDLLTLKSENDIDLHVEEVRKRGSQTKIGDKEYKLSDFDTCKDGILGELKRVKYHDLEDMVDRMQLTYNENMYVLDIKYFQSEKIGYTLPPGIYEVSVINRTLKPFLPDIVK